MKSEDGNKYRCVERTESSRKMRGARKTQTAYETNINRAIRNPPSRLGPPAEDLWKDHKPGDKESPQQAGSPLTAGNTSRSFTPNVFQVGCNGVVPVRRTGV